MTWRFRYSGHRFSEDGLRRLLGEQGVLGRDLDERARRVRRTARTLVGVDTGLLRSSIRIERGPGYRDIVAGIDGRTPYTLWHHDGTAPHVIRPRRGKALRFVWHGQVVFFAKVNHPGTRATRFLTRALTAGR